MEKKYLIVNIGSASKRYALYSKDKEELSIHFEKDEMNEVDFNNALEGFLESINKDEIEGIGLRVVASGSYFREDKLIDEELDELELLPVS